MSSLPGNRIEPQNILVLTTSYPRSVGDASGHFVAAEVDEMRKLGHIVTVYCPGPQSKLQRPSGHPQPRPQGALVDFIGGTLLFSRPGALTRLKANPARLAYLLAPSLRLWFRAQKQKQRKAAVPPFDQIVAHWALPSAFPWALWFSNKGTRLTVVFHGSDLQLLLRLPAGARHAVLRSLISANACFRFVSQRMKDELLATSLPQRLRDKVLQGTVRAAALKLPIHPTRKEARTSLGLGSDDRLAIFVGRLIPPKRPTTALNAASLLPGFRIIVIGQGPLEEQLRKRFSCAEFLGQRPHPETLLWLAAADICLSMSKNEGAPTVIREARALGVDVISSPCGDVAAWARDDPGLYLVES